jgi:hypothetical protein
VPLLVLPGREMPPDMIYSKGPTERIVKHSRGESVYCTDNTQMTIGVVQELGSIRHSSAIFPPRARNQPTRNVYDAVDPTCLWEIAL